MPNNPDPEDVEFPAFWEKLPPIKSFMERWTSNIEVLRGTSTATPPVDIPPFLDPIDPIDPVDPMLKGVSGDPSEAAPVERMEPLPDGNIEKPLPFIAGIPLESRGEENPRPSALAKDSLGKTSWNLTPPAVVVRDRGSLKRFDPVDCGRKEDLCPEAADADGSVGN